MSQIQSSVGLVSGIPILDTVDNLMAVSARPRDLIARRNEALKAEQVAISELTSHVLGVKLSVDRLGNADVFDSKVATSSDPSLLSATVTGNPPVGNFTFTPLRKAQSHQALSTGIGSLNDPLQNGTVSIGFGGFVDQGADFGILNDGEGITGGKLRITDRSGSSAVIDLRFARNIHDVLEAINSDSTINVTALTDGDRLKLVDATGQAASNLIVQEVDGGTTAASLGLAGIDVAADEAVGLDVVRLHDGLELNRLNANTGVGLRAELPDLEVTFADGSPVLSIDIGDASTVGELVAAINEADPSRLAARVSAGGDRLELEDLTTGTGTFSVSSPLGGTAAEDLGLTTSASGGVITGRRLLAGLGSPSLGSLNGGQGLGTTGLVEFTDRSGASTTVDLSSVETLDAVINQINGQAGSAGVGILARINAARSGIEILDTTGGSGDLTIANADATNTADQLGITASVAASAVDGGNLRLQILGPQTELSSLNGGRGVAQGAFRIIDSQGAEGAVVLNQPGAEITTVGGVIDAINAAGVAVTARLNDQGDGILIIDEADGSGTLRIEETGGGSTAADLHLLVDAQDQDFGGTIKQSIDGSTEISIDIDAITEDPQTAEDEQTTLVDLVNHINGLQAGITATTFFDGVNQRLLLTSDQTGAASQFQLETTGTGFSFQEVERGSEAVLAFGSISSGSAGIFVSSRDNTFDDVISGAALTIEGESTSAATISVATSDSVLVEEVQSFVDAYNALRNKLDDQTFFNEAENTTGVLFGSNEALRVETGLADLVSRRYSVSGDFQTLESVGVRVESDGTLSLDKSKLQQAFADDPEALEELFTDPDAGVSARFADAIDSLAASQTGLLDNRATALADKIDSNNDRIEFFDARLEKERARLLNEFFNLETMLAQLQDNVAALNTFQPIPPLTSSGP